MPRKPKQKLGPKPRFTEKATRKKLITGLTLLNTREEAIRYAGVSKGAFYQWIEKGEKGIEPYAKLLEDIQDAEQRAEIACLGTMVKAGGSGDWRAAHAFLKMKHPHKYASDRITIQHEHTTAEKAESLKELSDEQLAQYEAIHQTIEESSGS